MTILDPYHLKIDSVVMATYATGLETVDGIEGIPGRVIASQHAAYVDGTVPLLNTPSFFTGRQQRLRIWVSPFDADGAVTYANGPRAHLRENLESIFRLIGGRSVSAHTVDWLVPLAATTKTLRNTARITSPVFASGGSRLVRRLDILIDHPWPFFKDITTGEITLGPFTGAQSFTPGGTAPLADATFTCTSAGRITHDETGDFIEATSIPTTSVIINQHPPKTVTSGGVDARDVYNSNRPWGLRFDAGVEANLTITGTWQIDYYNAEH